MPEHPFPGAILAVTDRKEYFMDPVIRFVFDGRSYQVAMAVYRDGKDILLPNGILLHPSTWLESYPPIPTGLQHVPHLFQQLPIAEAADHLNACVAEEVS